MGATLAILKRNNQLAPVDKWKTGSIPPEVDSTKSVKPQLGPFLTSLLGSDPAGINVRHGNSLLTWSLPRNPAAVVET